MKAQRWQIMHGPGKRERVNVNVNVKLNEDEKNVKYWETAKYSWKWAKSITAIRDDAKDDDDDDDGEEEDEEKA